MPHCSPRIAFANGWSDCAFALARFSNGETSYLLDNLSYHADGLGSVQGWRHGGLDGPVGRSEPTWNPAPSWHGRWAGERRQANQPAALSRRSGEAIAIHYSDAYDRI
ncbi:hypothetical protein PsYK624_089960 [Phanerochaete sordida]|uniref:Uncharacterized protein n=1 Tax=Phanerochaete sordida TaxID=48140 RepID=A0A9P3GB60_9APHY|nr:hypothetical protein PsYK624_089960 [Phanerochaete sordida]